jgi:N-acetylmuramoyl-L-alanine amidase
MNNIVKYLFKIILAASFVFCSSNGLSQENREQYTVVLDAGHGGRDPGNRGNGYYEKKIALNIALQIGKILSENPLFKVVYTRKKDVFVDLIERADIANKAKADLFISIHCDSHNSKAYGAGTFVLGLHANQRNFEIAKKENSVIFLEENYEQKYEGFDPNSPESVISLVLMQEDYLDQSIVVADLIQKIFVSDLKRKNRTVKQAGFVVLKYTYMPSVLVETGFLTNKKEGAYLNSKNGQKEMAQSIAKGIFKYKELFNNEIGASSKDSFDSNIVSNSNEYFELKIQIASSKKNLPLKSYNFKGLSDLSADKIDNIYKYFFGKTNDYSSAKKLLSKAKKIGYKDSKIVAFKNGVRISLDEFLTSN